ncbi:hypothetical protein niasHT_010891 [Heterodera trifolii]|uniref:Uncharacterized protein n=1 Tax=Heterodera trifolii TaxID=157864 RepID=A0ABD2LII9_9BILA
MTYRLDKRFASEQRANCLRLLRTTTIGFGMLRTISDRNQTAERTEADRANAEKEETKEKTDGDNSQKKSTNGQKSPVLSDGVRSDPNGKSIVLTKKVPSAKTKCANFSSSYRRRSSTWKSNRSRSSTGTRKAGFSNFNPLRTQTEQCQQTERFVDGGSICDNCERWAVLSSANCQYSNGTENRLL